MFHDESWKSLIGGQKVKAVRHKH